MFKKYMDSLKIKDNVVKIISILIIAAVVLLTFDVFTDNRDGRRQIVDDDGGVEAELCLILSDIEGVGEVDVMLQYDDDEKVTGAIVTAQGADDPVVKNKVISAVMALFNISATSVEVFEKNKLLLEDDVNEK
ncbi:MAG: hypothetical protein Q4F78_01990 [Bacillota bacterium]|nr:hypothetical protein [Bacillota bacterium]